MKKIKKVKSKTKKIVKLSKKLAKKIKPFIGVPSVFVETKKVEIKSQTPIHDADYWLNRPEDDMHLDWDYADNWIEGYWESWKHPHRDLILEALKEFEPFDLLEVGCNVGPNLNCIKQKYGGIRLAGIDIDSRLVEIAKDKLRDIEFQVAGATRLPYDTQSFAVLLYDAVLMYLTKDEIKLAFDEIERVARKGVIIVDRFD